MYGIRPMVTGDLPQVAEIEREAFPEQRPATSFERELANKLARYLVLYETVEGSSERVLGHAGLWFIVDEAQLLTIAVRADHRRRGLGELLLIAGLDLATRREVRLMTLEVRVSNQQAQALYQKYGFMRVGRRRGYYTDNNEDAFLMTVEGLSDEAYQDRFRSLRAAYAARHGLSPIVLPS